MRHHSNDLQGAVYQGQVCGDQGGKIYFPFFLIFPGALESDWS